MKPLSTGAFGCASALLVALALSCGGGGEDGAGGSNGERKCSEERCTLGNCRIACLATGPDDPCCADPACQTDEICVGTTYSFAVKGLDQDGPACLIPQSLLAPLVQLLSETAYSVVIPHRAAFPRSILLDIPLFGPISVNARLVGDALQFDPVEISGIDLSQYEIPNLNCIVGGRAKGWTSELGSDTLEATIRISNMSVTKGPGTGECLLTVTEPCTLTVVSEGVRAP